MRRTININIVKPFLFGFGSLGNVSGGYVSFRRYLRGNNLDDLRKDWNAIGKDIRNAMSENR